MGTWYISAGDIAGECWWGEAHIATAGTCLGPTCPFGQDLLHLERAVAFQGCNGPISRDAKPDICQSDMASQGHIRGHLGVDSLHLSLFVAPSAWDWQETSLWVLAEPPPAVWPCWARPRCSVHMCVRQERGESWPQLHPTFPVPYKPALPIRLIFIDRWFWLFDVVDWLYNATQVQFCHL